MHFGGFKFGVLHAKIVQKTLTVILAGFKFGVWFVQRYGNIFADVFFSEHNVLRRFKSEVCWQRREYNNLNFNIILQNNLNEPK